MKAVHYSVGETTNKSTFDLVNGTPKPNKQYLILDSGYCYEVPDGFTYKIGEQYKNATIVKIWTAAELREVQPELQNSEGNTYELLKGK